MNGASVQAMNDATSMDLLERLSELNQIGIALSRQKDITRLLEVILAAAKDITNADGGTLYRVHQEKELRFEIMLTDSLGIAIGGSTGKSIPYLPVKLYEEDGRPNNSMVVAYAVLHDQTVNVADAYT